MLALIRAVDLTIGPLASAHSTPVEDAQFTELLQAQDRLDEELSLKAVQLYEGPGEADSKADIAAPWLVTLRIDGRAFCSGSLISETLVVTSAHCLSDQYGTASARSGFDSMIAGLGADRQTVAMVTEVHRFPGWTGDIRRGGDIGVVRIERGMAVHRAELLTVAEAYEFNPDAFAYVWNIREGAFVNGKASVLIDPQKFELAFVKRGACAAIFPEVRVLPVLCARLYDDDRNTCPKTGVPLGSPLLIHEIEQGNPRLIGVLSYCGRGNPSHYTAVYTDVRYFRKWLQSILDDGR